MILAASCLAQSSEFKLDSNRDWSAVKTPEPGTDAWTVAEARRLLAEDDPRGARALLDPWIELNRRSGSPLLPQALLVRGDALTALGKEFKALYDYEEIAKKHRESEEFGAAVGRELEIAVRYANGMKLRFLGFRWLNPEDILVELLIRVQERLPRSQAAERAAIELADYYYRRRDLKLAHDAYDLYIQNFPSGPNVVRAKQRRIQSDIGRFKGPRYNAAALINARVQIEDFRKRYPAEADATGMNEALVARLDESMAAQLLDTADWYLCIGDWPSARLTLRRLLRDHADTISGGRARAVLEEKGWLVEAESSERKAQSADSEEEASDDEVKSSAEPKP